MNRDEIFGALGLDDHSSGAYAGGWIEATGNDLASENPATNDTIGTLTQAAQDDYEKAVAAAEETFEEWRMVPAPVRGEALSPSRAAAFAFGPPTVVS